MTAPFQNSVIPHGNHNVLWEQTGVKDSYNSNRIVLSTFGLISENKNIETTLIALPQNRKKHPNLLYLMVGKTHPKSSKEGKNTAKKLEKLWEKTI
jgi:hypothetical protein